jgi:hypothetical protein
MPIPVVIGCVVGLVVIMVLEAGVAVIGVVTVGNGVIGRGNDVIGRGNSVVGPGNGVSGPSNGVSSPGNGVLRHGVPFIRQMPSVEFCEFLTFGSHIFPGAKMTRV